jgi:diguanylate cyclase (GGDEF)-like protein/PAS domain S-box-containing protein
MRDITGRKREEEKLAAQALTGPPSGLSMRRVSVKSVEDENYFQYLAEHSVDVIMRVSLERVVLYMSPSCIHLLGWKPEELVGKGLDFYILAEDMPHVEAKIAQILASKNQSSIGTARVRRKDKSIRWVEASIRLVRDSVTGEPEEFVNILRDITERKKEEVKLTALALTDGLTGLANRRAFDRTLDREWRRTLRAGSQMSLLLLDVDRFKRFNDRYGHQAGDDCLRAIAAAVSLSVRASDFAARYGGEEIAVILPSADTAGAVKVAEKIRSAIESLRLSHEGNPEHGGWVTASLGVATALARQGGSIKMPESLLLAADKALYEAKHEGRNRVATALVVASRRG